MRRIHIFGASGSGTTTLAEHLSASLSIPHFDSDEYYWKKTATPFTEKNTIEERHALFLHDLASHENWIISGSMTSWSQPFVPLFQLVVYLYVPSEIRVERLKIREYQRFGERILPNGEMHQSHREFIAWAAQYDEGLMTGRSKKRHEEWMSNLSCPVLKISGNHPVDVIVQQVTTELECIRLRQNMAKHLL